MLFLAILHVFPLFTSYNMQQLPSRGRHQDSVMPGVCYGQSLIAVVYGHFAWKRQDTGWQGVSEKLDPDCMRLQQTLLPVETQGSVGKKRQPVAVAVAHKEEEQVPTWAQ